MKITEAECWVACELDFESSLLYENAAQFDVMFDAVFTHTDGTKLVIPAFWYEKNTFKVRFAPTKAGTWNYQTVCADDFTLNGICGEIYAHEYSGELEIYKHGFVKNNGSKFFVYDDGTPFFYLGDTHWGMYGEEFDSLGEYAGYIKSFAGYDGSDSHFKYIVNKRIGQGFTVYQSEPGGRVLYNLKDGVDEKDIEGFKEADKYFSYIAEKGLVHANAQFFYISNMTPEIFENKRYLEKLARMWVARYSAYPVLWTLAQEADNDFYAERASAPLWNYTNNPWVSVAEYIHKYDAYGHPLTAHQENTDFTTVTGRGTCGGNGVKPDNGGRSLFASKEVSDKTGHNWWGVQWQPYLGNYVETGLIHTDTTELDVIKDYWESEKISVLYESRYDGMWTMEFGARAQGWVAYLNGFFGYGYGAQDIWAYNNDFMKRGIWDDGCEYVTQLAKYITWPQATELPSAKQMGIMKEFFLKNEWYDLIPDFKNENYFIPDTRQENLYAIATKCNEKIVLYLYGKNTLSGKLKNLDGEYEFLWFDVKEGRYIIIESLQCTEYMIPQKPDNRDWIFVANRISPQGRLH